MAVISIAIGFLVLWPVIAIADLSIQNDKCQDFARALGSGCTINGDCTEVKCIKNGLGDKELSVTIKINKCEEPVTIDITVTALGFYWEKTFESSDKIAIPGLSFKPAGKFFSAGVYLQVNLKDTGSNLQLKIIILTGAEVLGSFQKITQFTIADSHLPIGTPECGIVKWWKSLGNLQYLFIAGAIIFIVCLIVCCYCCCCRKRTRNGGQVVVIHHPTAVAPTGTMPMQSVIN